MDITFASKKLKKQMNEHKVMVKAHGSRRAKALKLILTQLAAAQNLGIFAPPYSPPHRCHELKGKRKGQLSFDLDHPYRLIVVPDHDPIPTLDDGGLDWHAITAVKIKAVEDTHG